jgi:hypothetical protein
MTQPYLTTEDQPTAAVAQAAAVELSKMIMAAPPSSVTPFSRRISFRGYDVELGGRVIPPTDTLKAILGYRWQFLVRVDLSTAKALGLDVSDDATSSALQALESPVIQGLVAPMGRFPKTCWVHHQVSPDATGTVFPLHHRTMGKFRGAFYALGDM